MAMNFVKKLPIPAEVKKMYPLSDRVVEIKKKRDAEIRDVFTGASDKFILIIGPCSADNVDSVLDYIHRLASHHPIFQASAALCRSSLPCPFSTFGCCLIFLQLPLCLLA